MSEKNCIDCHHLRTKIPLKKIKGGIKLQYTKAKTFCRCGMLVKEGDVTQDRIFLNVLRNYKKPMSFETAKRCPYYDDKL